MNHKDPTEKKIDDLFQEMKETDEANAPSFLKHWHTAQGLAREKRKSPVFSRVAGAMVALILIGISVALLWKNEEQRGSEQNRAQTASSISQWYAPTDFLMKSAGDDWLKTTPRVGESVQQFRAFVPEKN